MNETQNGIGESPNSLAVGASVKDVVTVDAKLCYGAAEDGTAVLYRLRAFLQEAARLFPTFCLGEDLTPRG